MDNTAPAVIGTLGGVDETVPPRLDSANEIVNFTRHQRTGGWDNRIGYERYFFSPTMLWTPFNSMGRVDSLYVWSRHQGAMQFVLVESGGSLFHLTEWGDSFRLDAIKTSRTVPAASQPVTSYVPFGRFLLIVNGEDLPLKYVGWPSAAGPAAPVPVVPVYELGWSNRPGAPFAWNVHVDARDLNPSRSISIWAGDFDSSTTTQNEIGLGSSTGDADNMYKWKVAFRSISGSLSPLSGPSNGVSWETPAVGDPFPNSRYVVGLEIPVGPPGTISRMLYRTKNLGDGSEAAEVYYEVREIPNNIEDWIYDHVGDNQLGNEAPSDFVTFPCPQARYGEVFAGCAFFDGGPGEETRVYWSNPGQPDSYSALDFAELGGKEAGGITGFRSTSNFMVILREKGVDVARGNYTDGFTFEPLVRGVGGKAGHAMTEIPGLGIILLATDGVYLVTGGVEGGGMVTYKKISNPIMGTIDRINLDTSIRAAAAYSHMWREWHCYLPLDGAEKPTRGIVLHVDDLSWTFRDGFPVSCLATDFDGNLIFGHHTGDNGAGNPDPSGLFVISHRRTTGGAYVPAIDPVPAYIEDNAAPTSRYRSPWHDFGDARYKKHVKYVYLKVLTTGDNAITMTVFKDYEYSGTALGTKVMQRPDRPKQGVYDDAAELTGTAIWEDHMVTEIRFDIGDKACSHFLFEIETNEDFVLLGYEMEYSAAGAKVITGRTS